MIESTRKKMTLTLPSDLEIELSRAFDAPAKLVFEAWTKPEHVAKWWGGCRTMSMPVCEIDLRVGGAFRYVLRMPDGSEYPFKGVYREIDPPARLVHTQIFDVEPYSSAVAVVTVTFAEEQGQTLVTETIRHASVEARDGHLQSGMKEGAAESFDKLEEVLEGLS